MLMLEGAGRIAEQLHEAKRRVWGLAAQLRGLSGVWLPTAGQSMRPLRLPPRIEAGLAQEEPQYAPTSRPEMKQAERWRAFYAALMANPDARFDGAQ